MGKIKNIDAACTYLPLGGLQFLVALVFLIRGPPFARFCALQSILYYPVAVATFIFLLLLSSLSGERTVGIFALIAGFIMIAVIPCYLAYKISKGITVYFPIIGKPLARLVGYNENEVKK